ncbi:NAD-dependent dehydratase [Acuticoccus sediminis]|uniref:NAD-dependent dehydratase n=1 Tax=Acuticoccus sediminis TaxID=2184697 RepID=A0A8B2NQP7_9HYPH|nr:SDR family oxidoreductase [Acuticoccus sediminis]RAH98345.1 NAD-dependent dehydratase [Acuticoccus sediminis]
MNHPFRLDQTTAIVTGGASGIGAATAAMLTAAGATVAVLDLDLDRAAAVAAPLAGAYALQCDVASESSVEAAVAAVCERAVPGVLVNCAGVAIREAAVSQTLGNWNKVVDVNLTGSFLTSRVVARAMIEAGIPGSIVQTASIMGLSGGGVYPNVSYQTTKGALVNMTRALAVEWAPSGIRVNAVAPTYVRTPFIRALLDQPDIMARIYDMTPLRRLAEPEEVASAILFLASPAAAMVTGHTLPVDGGFLAQ